MKVLDKLGLMVDFDLMILDVQVPKLDGFELLKSLRDSNIQIPCIFTTSLNSIEDLDVYNYFS